MDDEEQPDVNPLMKGMEDVDSEMIEMMFDLSENKEEDHVNMMMTLMDCPLCWREERLQQCQSVLDTCHRT